MPDSLSFTRPTIVVAASPSSQTSRSRGRTGSCTWRRSGGRSWRSRARRRCTRRARRLDLRGGAGVLPRRPLQPSARPAGGLAEPEPTAAPQVRQRLYELLINCIPPELIIKARASPSRPNSTARSLSAAEPLSLRPDPLSRPSAPRPAAEAHRGAHAAPRLGAQVRGVRVGGAL